MSLGEAVDGHDLPSSLVERRPKAAKSTSSGISADEDVIS